MPALGGRLNRETTGASVGDTIMVWITRAQLWCSEQAEVRSERGGNMVEYMLLLVLIAVLLIAVVAGIGHQVSTRFSSASSAFPT